MPKSFSVYYSIHFFQSKEGIVCERRLSIFDTFLKMYPEKCFHNKKFQCLKLKIFFFKSKERNVCGRRLTVLSPLKKIYPDKISHAKMSIKGKKYMWKKNINFCTLSQMYPDKSVYAKKNQCLKLNSFFQSKERNVCGRRLTIFVTFKKTYPDKTPMPKSQSKEGNVCERRIIIFAPFQKMYPDKYFHVKKLQCLKTNTIFSIKGTKCMWKKTNNFCHF